MANVLDRNFDFATNGTVTAAGLHNLIDDTNIYAGLISTQEERTSVGTGDLLLIANSSSIGSPQIAANRTTVYNLFDDALTGGTYVNAQLSGNLTYGTATGNRTVSTSATITNGTITNGVIPTGTFGTTTSTAATITTGTIPTLTTGTTTSTAEIVTSGTIATLNSTTGTIATLNSTNATISNLSATTSTFIGAITGSTNVINIGSGQVYKNSSGDVGIGTTSPGRQLSVSGASAALGITSTAAGGNTVSIDPATTANGGLAQIDCSGANALRFNTNGTERIRIASAGQIGIGGANYGTTGQVLTSNGASSAPSWQQASGLTSGTSVATTSGTAFDFTGIPSSAKRISILFSRVATGTSYYLVQLGTSSAINTTDYRSLSNAMDQGNGNASTLIRTDGMVIYNDTLAVRVVNGIMTISLVDSATNSWVSSHSVGLDTNLGVCGGGSISLSGALTRIRVTTVSANTFTAGTLNILYEG
jgi:hypothetical protein